MSNPAGIGEQMEQGVLCRVKMWRVRSSAAAAGASDLERRGLGPGEMAKTVRSLPRYIYDREDSCSYKVTLLARRARWAGPGHTSLLLLVSTEVLIPSLPARRRKPLQRYEYSSGGKTINLNCYSRRRG